jgi:hypothetical protein
MTAPSDNFPGILAGLADPIEYNVFDEAPVSMERESFMLTRQQAERLQREVKELRKDKAELVARIDALVRQVRELEAVR